MIELLQLTLDGLLDGSAYALVGLGLTLTFGSLRRLNLAYGASAMLAAYLGAWFFQHYALPTFAVAIVVIVACALIGFYVEWLCFSGKNANPRQTQRAGAALPGSDTREVVALASSFAIWMQLEQLAVNLLPQHLNTFPSLASTREFSLGAIVMRFDKLALASFAVVLTLTLAYWLRASRSGLAWRAAADQRAAAYLCGIAVPQVQRFAFAAACMLGGVAAFAVLSLEGQVTPMFGMWVLIKGLVAAMLGGIGSIRGVLIGGLLLGVVEAHAQALFGALGREFITYALLFLVLVLPWRRFAHEGELSVR